MKKSKGERNIMNKLIIAIALLPALLLADDRKPIHVLQPSKEIVEFIAAWEGFSPTIYACPSGYPTIGYGRKLSVDEVGIINEAGGVLTQHEAMELLHIDVYVVGMHVKRFIDVPLSQHEFDALVSWTYNCGPGALSASTLREYINMGMFEEVPGELIRWIYAGGEPLSGLYDRRIEESHIWTHGRYLR